MSKKKNYLIEGRLADVLALIQVLGLDKRGHRGEVGLNQELQGIPRSATSWTQIAIEHPEFFRVDQTTEHGLSLIARHVTEPNQNGIRELSFDVIKKLIEIAIELHDRQKERADRWKTFLPILAIIIAGIINFLATVYFNSNNYKNNEEIELINNEKCNNSK